jgi:hypothetical protein
MNIFKNIDDRFPERSLFNKYIGDISARFYCLGGRYLIKDSNGIFVHFGKQWRRVSSPILSLTELDKIVGIAYNDECFMLIKRIVKNINTGFEYYKYITYISEDGLNWRKSGVLVEKSYWLIDFYITNYNKYFVVLGSERSFIIKERCYFHVGSNNPNLNRDRRTIYISRNGLSWLNMSRTVDNIGNGEVLNFTRIRNRFFIHGLHGVKDSVPCAVQKVVIE